MSTSATAPATGVAGPPTGGVQLSHRQILEILGGLMLGMFLAALDQTIVTSAIRTIGDDLHGLSVQAWVTTAYLITATISTPLYGKLSDIYGRKRFFLAAITIFVIGSAACSFATSMYMLAGFRAFQGLGAGGLFSLALAIIGDIVPPRERARYQGYFLAVFGTSSVLGPVIGGFFAGADSILGIAGWRWVFLVNVPIGIVALAVVAKVLHLKHTRRPHRIDWWGALTICICLVPALIVAEQGRAWGWASQRSLICYLVAGVGLILFIVAEALMKQDALIPLRFFRNTTFSLTSIAGFIVGMGMFGGLALLPLYLQIVRGATPTQSGLQLLPLTAGIMVGSVLSGQTISRTGRYKIFPVLGAALMVGGLWLLHTVGVDTEFWRTGVYMAVFGFGLGFIMQPITLAVQNAMSPQDIGVATSSVTFFRQMGATAGTAIFLSILFSSVGDKIKDAFAAAAKTPAFQQALADPAITGNPANQPILGAAHGGGAVGSSALNDTSFLAKVTPVLARPFKIGFSDTMDMIFIVAGAILVIAFVLLLFLPQIPLRTQSAMSAREGAPDTGSPADRPAGPATSGQPAAGATLEIDSGRRPDDEPSPAESTPPAGVPAGPSASAPAGPSASAPAGPSASAPAGPSAVVPADQDGAGHRPETLADVDSAPPRMPLSNEALVTGRVDGPGGGPVSGATLTLTDFGGTQLARAVTGVDGTYRMVVPTGGTFLFICAAEHHQPAASLLTVTGGEMVRDVALTGAGQIEGVVTDQHGRPIPGAALTLTDAPGEVVGSAVSGSDGGYLLADLHPADYTLSATARGTRPTACSVTLDGTGTARADLVLLTNATLAGHVRAATSGLPVADASVMAIDQFGAVAGAAVTGADGRYEFAGLAAGVYTVTASGYAPVATRVEVAGDRADHDIVLGIAPNGRAVMHAAATGEADGTAIADIADAVAEVPVPRTAGPADGVPAAPAEVSTAAVPVVVPPAGDTSAARPGTWPPAPGHEGPNAADGSNGAHGHDGADGSNGPDGCNGADGSNGADAPSGLNTSNGAHRHDGVNGARPSEILSPANPDGGAR